jgi:hypothetical protein
VSSTASSSILDSILDSLKSMFSHILLAMAQSIIIITRTTKLTTAAIGARTIDSALNVACCHAKFSPSYALLEKSVKFNASPSILGSILGSILDSVHDSVLATLEKSVKITALSSILDSILDSIHDSVLDSVLATNLASLNKATVNLENKERRDTGFSRCWILSKIMS